MRILQIAKYYYPYRGGIETVQKSLCEGLVRSGHQVTVLCASSDRNSSVEVINGIKVHRLPCWGTPASQPLTPSLRREWRARLKDHDLVHLHSPNPLAETLAIGAAHVRPVITTYHSDIIRQKFLGAVYRPILNKFLATAQRIVVPTPYHIDYSPVLLPFAAKCAIVPFGLPEADYAMTSDIRSRCEKLRRQYGPFLLFVGRLVGYKGVDVLLHAMTRTSCKLIIVGSGPQMHMLKELAKELRVDSRVHFTAGIEDDSEMLAHFHSCEALVLPSVTRNEAFGMVLLEAMACAKPVISTKLDSGVRLVNLDQVTGLQVDPSDPEQLGQAIERLMTNAQLRTELGAAGLSRFHNVYTDVKMVEGYEAVYRSAVAQDSSQESA